jgi:hypothetical protein
VGARLAAVGSLCALEREVRGRREIGERRGSSRGGGGLGTGIGATAAGRARRARACVRVWGGWAPSGPVRLGHFF